jgi:hypothetical protein
MPKGVCQRNISRTRKYRCSTATSVTATAASVFIGGPPFGRRA